MKYTELLEKLESLRLQKPSPLLAIFVHHDLIINKDLQFIIRKRKILHKPHLSPNSDEYVLIASYPIENFAKQITEDAAETVLMLNKIDPLEIVANRYGKSVRSKDTSRGLSGKDKEAMDIKIANEEEKLRQNILDIYPDEIFVEKNKQIELHRKEVNEQVIKTRDFILSEIIKHAHTKQSYQKALYYFGYKDEDLGKFGL